MAALVFQYPTDVVGKRFVDPLKGIAVAGIVGREFAILSPRSDSTSSATARNCNTATSLSLSEGIGPAKAISVPFIKAKPGMAMAAPAAVILKNERRFCVDIVLELLIKSSLCY